MRGRVEARREAHELALYTAWQGERFHRVDRLKSFGSYLREARKPPPSARPASSRQPARQMLAAFADLAAAGAPIIIERI